MTATQRRIAVIASAGSVVLIGAAAIALWPRAEEVSVNLPQTAEEGLQVMSSDAFTTLPDYRQDAYRQETRRLVTALPDDERRGLFEKYRNTGELDNGLRRLRFNPLQSAMEEYNNATPEERTAVMDKMIDRMEQFRAMGALRGPAGRLAGGGQNAGAPSGATPGQPGGGDPAQGGSVEASRQAHFRQRFEKQIQQGDPQKTAQLMEFFKRMRERRRERGLPDL